MLYGKEALLNAMPPYQAGGDMIRLVRFDKSEYNTLPYKFEAGTPAIADAIGLGAAIDYVSAIGIDTATGLEIGRRLEADDQGGLGLGLGLGGRESLREHELEPLARRRRDQDLERVARQRALRLLRRVRVLLAVLVILFAFFTPGEALLPFPGSAGPTVEGLVMAATHVLRLVVVVTLVALLLEMVDERTLVSGLMGLAMPLAVFGLSVERLAVRTLLVFRYVESAPVGGWRTLISEESNGMPEEAVMVVFRPLRWFDRLVIGCLLALIFLVAVM